MIWKVIIVCVAEYLAKNNVVALPVGVARSADRLRCAAAAAGHPMPSRQGTLATVHTAEKRWRRWNDMGKDFDSGADYNLDCQDGVKRIYTTAEILEAVRDGRITGPIGMNTFMVFVSDGKTVDCGGYVDRSAADDLAFAIMDMKRKWNDMGTETCPDKEGRNEREY